MIRANNKIAAKERKASLIGTSQILLASKVKTGYTANKNGWMGTFFMLKLVPYLKLSAQMLRV